MINNSIINKFNKSNVSSDQKSLSFKRALTSSEKATNNAVVTEALKELRTKSFTIIGFDTHFPTNTAFDTGSGSALSDDAQALINKIKSLLGLKDTKTAVSETGKHNNFVNLQLEPQGNALPCPYDSTVFSLGNHIIDLKKLTLPLFGYILPENDPTYNEMISKNPNRNTPNKVDFDHLIKYQKEVLHVAFENFLKLQDTSKLKMEFEAFKSDNNSWLKPDAIYDILAQKNNDSFWPNWKDDVEKNLFNDNYHDKNSLQARINQIEQDNPKEIEFYKFCQFIATSQLQQAKQEYNHQNVDLIGDCLLAFSPKDQWANKAAFLEGSYMGCQGAGKDPNQYWGFPALDTSKLAPDQPAGKLLKLKFDTFFDRYDGARIDAAWGLITPWVYKADPKTPGKHTSEGVFDNSIGDKIIKILLNSAEAKNVDKSKIYLELLGKITQETWNLRDQFNLPAIGITQYGDWYSPTGTRNPNNKSDKDYYAHGTHDHPSIAKLAKTKPSGYTLEKNTELMGSFKPVFTLPDILGDDRIINDFTVMSALNKLREELAKKGTPENQIEEELQKQLPQHYKTAKENWTLRIADFEKTYYQNLTENKGLNLAEALKKALDDRNIGSSKLKTQLDKIASILKTPDPQAYTTEEANRKFGESYNAIS